MINHKAEAIMSDYINILEAHLKKIDQIEYRKFIDELANIHSDHRDRIVAELRNVVKQVYDIVGAHNKR